MALLKSIDVNNTGILAEYHHISCAEKGFYNNFDQDGVLQKIKYVKVDVLSYKDAAARQANKNSMMSKRYAILAKDEPEKFEQLFGDAAAGADGVNFENCCYEYLKTLPDFEGAQDI